MGSVTNSFINVFGNINNSGLYAFTARGSVVDSVVDVTDGDIGYFIVGRLVRSTVQAGAEFTKGNTVDAAVNFSSQRRIGVIVANNTTLASSKFRKSEN